jgi:hypothetical protein
MSYGQFVAAGALLDTPQTASAIDQEMNGGGGQEGTAQEVGGSGGKRPAECSPEEGTEPSVTPSPHTHCPSTVYIHIWAP